MRPNANLADSSLTGSRQLTGVPQPCSLFASLLVFLAGVSACVATQVVTSEGSNIVGNLDSSDIVEAFPDDFPSSSSPGYQQSIQGIAHDARNWFVANQCNLYRIPVEHNLDDHDGRFVTTPMRDAIPCWAPAWLVDSDYNCTTDLGDLADKALLATSPAAADMLHNKYVTPNAFPQWISTYGPSCSGLSFKHLGDPAFHAGHLWVPVEAQEGRTAVAVFGPDLDIQGIAFLQTRTASGELQDQSSASWLAVDPQNGEIFTSEFSSDHFNVYKPTLTPGHGTGLVLEYQRSVRMHRAAYGIALNRIQGGEFSPAGTLYMVEDQASGGIFAFDRSGLLVAEHHVEYLPHRTIPQELEGITFWDIDGRGAPTNDSGTTVSGQLHLVMGQSHAGYWDDNMWIKHYAVHEAAENAFPLVQNVERRERMPDPGDPDADMFRIDVPSGMLFGHAIHVDAAHDMTVTLAPSSDPSHPIPLTRRWASWDYYGALDPGTYLLTLRGFSHTATFDPVIDWRAVGPAHAPICTYDSLCGGEVEATCSKFADSNVWLERLDADGVFHRVGAQINDGPIVDVAPDGDTATYRACANNAVFTLPQCSPSVTLTVQTSTCGGGGDGGRGGCWTLANGKRRCYGTHE